MLRDTNRRAEARTMLSEIFDLLNRKDLPTEEWIAPLASNMVYHRAGMPDVTGLTGMRQVLDMSRSAIADMHATIEDLVAEGDKVACRWSARFTHQGEVTVTGIAIYRVLNSEIQEEWDYSDALGLMEQLGRGPLQGNG
ncbi:MAG: ester cyclase [Deltaproteobacteria bacterium]|nr:ester cyclase [Deltaproteobacteria bacterium]